jgi:hypothetical protein
MINTAVTGATYDIDGGQQFAFRTPTNDRAAPLQRRARMLV